MTAKWSKTLRDHGSREAADRVWRRLDSSMKTPRTRTPWGPTGMALGAAAVFVLGVWVGRGPLGDTASIAVTAQPGVQVQAEPVSVVREVPPVSEEKRKRTERPRNETVPHTVDRPRVVPSPLVPPAEEENPSVDDESELIPPAVVPSRNSEWKALVDRGEYAAAFQAVERAGGFDVVLVTASAEDLMTLADVARSVGQPGRAIQALRQVVHVHPSDANAPLAALMLGNLLHRAGDAAGAAEAYALNRRLSPQGDFAEDALAREIEVAIEEERLSRARELVGQYEAEFPQGRRLDDLRAQLLRAEELRGVPFPSEATSPTESDDSDDESETALESTEASFD